ncbi:MAG: hypothetical protein K0U41_03930, partial [Gammaproteobacteria bacterium]|nr:hypothetical protein [Gammaproteobacteria bacterium]
DADGTLNEDDYDDDGNGLIDIANVSDFNLIRENLRGSNLPQMPGCLNSRPIGKLCYGYELVADIDFSDHGNWEPLGGCEIREQGTNLPLCISSNMFSSLLEGNNHTLSNISIHQNSGENTFGIGLFGAIASSAEIRNMHLVGVSITKGSDSFPWYVGALAGVADGGTISSVSVSGDSVIGSFFVGGLVGFSYKGTRIDNTHAKFTKVESAFQNAGGLVGYISECTITSSSAKSNEVSSLFSPGGRAGGLVGTLDRCNVRQSYAINGIVNSKDQHAGGLIGRSDDSNISSSYATSDLVVTRVTLVGGFIGAAVGSKISTSFSQTHSVTGSSRRSGFVGAASSRSTIESSYAFTGSRTDGNATEFVFNIDGGDTVLKNSYAVSKNKDTLWAGGSSINVDSSYWDLDVSGATTDANARATSVLQGTTDFTGDYMNWGMGWCDPLTGEFTTDQTHAQAAGYVNNIAWDLGGANDYPVISCFNSITPAQQRQLHTDFLNNY